MDKFQKNYEEFFRGYTPDVNSFKSYDNIKNNMNTQSSEKPAVDQMNKYKNIFVFQKLSFFFEK